MTVVTEDTYRCQKCSLQHLGLQRHVQLAFHASPGAQGVTQDQRFCELDPLARLGLHKRTFDESSSQGWGVVRRATSAPVLGQNPKCSAPSETSSHGQQWHVLVACPPLSAETPDGSHSQEAWDLALPRLWWYPGTPDIWLGVTGSSRVRAAGGIFPHWPLLAPGEKLWVTLHR